MNPDDLLLFTHEHQPSKNQRNKIVTSLAKAFVEDPFFLALDSTKRRFSHHYHFRMGILKSALENGRIITTPDFKGAAILYRVKNAHYSPLTSLKNGSFFQFFRGGKLTYLLNKYCDPIHNHYLSSYCSPESWYIAVLGVDPEFQNQGYGKAIMHQIFDFVREKGDVLYLETQNEANIKYYHHLGLHTISSKSLPEPYAQFNMYFLGKEFSK